MGGVTRTLAYTYDANGNRLSIIHPDGNWFGAIYDGLNRQYYLHANNILAPIYRYHAPHGGVSAVGRPGIGTWLGYDAVQRPATLTHAAYTPAAADVAFAYTRNPAGQIASVARNNDAYAWTGAYTINRAYTTNGLNQYSAAGGTALGYDANGNLISETPPSPAPPRTYTYDIENRLVGAPNGVTLSYDPLGRLYEVSSSGAPATRFLYDGDALVAEYVAGTMTRRHAHWQGADVPVATFEVPAGGGLGTVRPLFADHQGSIIAIGDGAGAVTAINRYDEYGIPAGTNTGRFQYTGQAWLAELGMYYYKARIYSPTLGRFLQTDPVGYEGAINLYAYVGNDPVNLVDPTGECATVEGQRVGICGTTDDEVAFIVARIADSGKSEIGQLETLAIEKRQLISFRFGTEAPEADSRGRITTTHVDGGRTNVTRYTGSDKIDISVTVNRQDDVTVRGVDRWNHTADRTLTTEEKAEHELASHARDALERRTVTGPAQIDPDNRYFRRAGINFRRVSHDTDTVRVRRNGR